MISLTVDIANPSFLTLLDSSITITKSYPLILQELVKEVLCITRDIILQASGRLKAVHGTHASVLPPPPTHRNLSFQKVACTIKIFQ